MSTTGSSEKERSRSFRALAVGGFALGFGASGFFDGVLLHQLLQWHQLLSGLQMEEARDLRVQVVADGVFHATMYLVAVLGIWVLWRRRRDLGDAGSAKVLAAASLAGFGSWHTVDPVLVGLHNIRMEENWLFWDVLWIVLFGVLFVVAAWLVTRRDGMRGTGQLAALVLIPATLFLGVWAMSPPVGASAVLVLFPSETPPERAFAVVRDSGAKVLWTDASQGVWVVDESAADFIDLDRNGALFVSPAFLPADRLDWSQFRA